jgi:high affinity sulfate transporter 1
LAALAIPEALGYAKIAGMPVVTGLFTMLLPAALFALIGSSRHLVVGADSATAAILSASLAASAAPGSQRYVQLAGTTALMTGLGLLLARAVGLGFLANFLSRTVLVGFLTGVGISVACSQLPEMLGLPPAHGTIASVSSLELARVNVQSLLLAAAVVIFVLLVRRITHRIPGGLIAVVVAIALSYALDLRAHGVPLLGDIPRGLPALSWPSFALDDLRAMLKPMASMAVVILAQSAATARSYAAKYDEPHDSERDLVGLGIANLSAAFSGTFVVNGSPTKTQMVDGAGGRSQLAQLVTASIVLLVLLFLTAPRSYLPNAALSALVFLIGLELIDVAGMLAILRVRRHEFAVALLTSVCVALLGVERGILIAVLASVIDHLRHSYAPHNGVLVIDRHGHLRNHPVFRGARTQPGLVIMRFGSSLYYANARDLSETVQLLLADGPPPTHFCLDLVAVGDIDYTAGSVLRSLYERLSKRGVRLLFSQPIDKVRAQLDKYGVSALVGADAFYDEPIDVVRAQQSSNT